MEKLESNNPAEGDVFLNCVGNPQHELRNSALTQETSVYNGRGQPHGGGNLKNRRPHQRMSRQLRKIFIWCFDGTWSRPIINKTLRRWVVCTLIVALIVSAGFNIYQYVKLRQFSSETSCSQGWVRNEDQCYYFSSVERNWTFSQSHCSSFGGSLVSLDSQKEREFVESKRDLDDYWINFQKKSADQPWTWPNGSLVVNSLFPIGGEGLCAYLNEKVVSSTNCDNTRRWMCKKSLLSA